MTNKFDEELAQLRSERDEARNTMAEIFGVSLEEIHDPIGQGIRIFKNLTTKNKEKDALIDQLKIESEEQARLLGMSGSREAKLLADIKAKDVLIEKLKEGMGELAKATETVVNHPSFEIGTRSNGLLPPSLVARVIDLNRVLESARKVGM